MALSLAGVNYCSCGRTPCGCVATRFGEMAVGLQSQRFVSVDGGVAVVLCGYKIWQDGCRITVPQICICGCWSGRSY
ncbi:hypothetical protein RRG08_013768 [Elysia crispata]|uniref:Uncharacterized protein n=1 Tax=Elysia crispata TaxID=231223 RepID=A0AAE1D8E6_9GAST|nr:hypothetical protein RRG08_013768 [Elysia crispata]